MLMSLSALGLASAGTTGGVGRDSLAHGRTESGASDKGA